MKQPHDSNPLANGTKVTYGRGSLIYTGTIIGDGETPSGKRLYFVKQQGPVGGPANPTELWIDADQIVEDECAGLYQAIFEHPAGSLARKQAIARYQQANRKRADAKAASRGNNGGQA